MPLDRATANDLTVLATDRGPAPMNMGAVVVVDGADGLDVATVRATLAERLAAVPRLRRRLEPVPPGCGRPVWVDDPAFALDRHVTTERCPAPGGDAQLLDLAAAAVCRRLPRDRPPWSVRWVTGLRDGRAALVVVMHHVVADGLGGLAVLGALTDDGAGTPAPVGARPRPGVRELVADAWRERAAALRHPLARGRRAAAGLRELGLGERPRPAPATRLNRPTGARRRLTTVATGLAPVREVAHRHGGTVNDVVLTAVVGAMAATLARTGARPAELVVSVPVSGRHPDDGHELGNRTGVIPVRLPTTGDAADRLDRVGAVVRQRRVGSAAASSAAPLGAAFRLLARLGLFSSFVEHQRLVNTFVTNVRGPDRKLAFAGRPVTAVVPVTITPGNVGVSFAVLSYDGRLVVSLVADPTVVPDQDVLTELLRAELAALVPAEVVATPLAAGVARR